MQTPPGPRGLYDPRFEHDSCGVSFVANIKGVRSHELVHIGLVALTNLEHRGATGAEPDTGDGAGILVQVPDRFLREVIRAEAGVELPPSGAYAVGMAFLPTDHLASEKAQAAIETIVADERLSVVAWRDVPVVPSCLGATARAAMPSFRHLIVTDPAGSTGVDLDRKAFLARKRIEHELEPEIATYFPSLSSRTLVYKGMLTTPQLGAFFPDLSDERFESALLLVHSRFSTNTFPSWPLAHPYRYIAHNGEINTVQGNQNWMRAREAMLDSAVLAGVDRAFPICTPGASDTARFDEVLELLHLGGRPIHHAVLMMIPEAWENNDEMDPAQRAFYRFHSTVMEPWDGPASVTFTDGTVIGAVLDRNGLRPSRYWVTDDDLVVMASEVGVIDIDPAKVITKGRLQPGRMFLIDTAQGRIVDDEEIKTTLAAEHPYAEWLEQSLVELDDLPEREHVVFSHESVLRRQQLFGYTHEELKVIIAPTALKGTEPLGSMGTDTPIAVLSTRPRLLFDYFAQLFAQVTNPPLDAIREEVVTSVSSTIGPEADLLRPGPESCRQLVLPFPIIDNDELLKIIHANDGGRFPGLRSYVVKGLYRVAGGGLALERALAAICGEVSAAIEDGARIIVLSDRNADEVEAPIPSLLLTAAVHHHLVRTKQRTMVGLLVECGDAREVHHMALLIGYGAGAINPYLAFESIEDLIAQRMHGLGEIDSPKAMRNYIKACGKGVLKVMSKMGVSTVASYTGAQIFEALGLGEDLVEQYFSGTVSRLGGIGLDEIAAEVAARHAQAHPTRPEERAHRKLELGGEYQWRREGEIHLFNPETVFKLQHATRAKRYDIFRQYSRLVDDQSQRLATLRGLFELRRGQRPSIPIDEVESASSIMRRFSTGAMSYGSISAEAHETLAIAMNRLGAKSNTGEGGEDADRLHDPRRRSAIKQVASGRFGVTAEYLTNADDLQIKMAQGAKPGEGGQLPGHKVYPWIAKTRYSTPGVGLISPPPHHDIYSIEDLKQLIHDLKNSNPTARVHVKLVAEVGVGTVAAGVSKAKADVVLISGHDGGTGASPLTSLKHAGGPWELGLAETQQTLLLNGLRDRIVVQTDGQLKTGRDVVVAALLGAEEFGFATAPLVVSGCVMMRVCHLDTCPVGIATQNPELRKRFSGKPEFVETFFEFIAEEVRELMAELGFRTMAEMIGHVEALDTRAAIDHWKAAGLDISPILAVPQNPYGQSMHQSVGQDHGLRDALDVELIRLAQPAIHDAQHVDIDLPIRNVNRTVGTMLGHEITKRWEGAGLPDGTIDITLTGSAGQSFGAFVPAGVTLRLVGDANDYLGKGLSGGRIVVAPPPTSPFVAEEQIVAGNVIAYGATGGEIFLRGVVGERFCVRNSGALAVAEGVGDHGCEYMTGGRVVVLGPTGRNFGAGMSGGIAYVLDADGQFRSRLNDEMVMLDEMDDEDRTFLHDVVSRHGDLTGSAVADRLLASWSVAVSRFRKVMPLDYKRVLAVMKASRDQKASTRPRRCSASWKRVTDEHASHRCKEYVAPCGWSSDRFGPRPQRAWMVGSSGDRAPQAPSASETRPSERVFERTRPPVMGEATGFLKWDRALPTRRPIPVRILDWKEVYEDFPAEAAQTQAGRCMDCGIPFCNNGCPLGNLIPDWNDLVYRDHWQEAIDKLHATNNFPEFTGRLCPAPCEAACVLGINADPVTIKQVEVEIIDRAWEEGWVSPQVPSVKTGKRVAVIGSGPAGLAVAQQLTRAGHDVVVLERADRIGGLLRYGIPEFKMEKRHLERRLAQMEAEGTEFRTNAAVGDGIDIDVLLASTDAIVMACGATAWRDLPVPGRELAGIHQAMEYLPWSNRVQEGDLSATPITAEGKHVVIIGGGDTGADCLGTAHRHGAASITQLEILPRPPDERAPENPWPQWSLVYRVSSAHEEGGDRVFSVNTERFVDDGAGNVKGLLIHEVEMVDGRFVKVEGTDRELPADLVLLAMGFVGPERAPWLERIGIELDERGNVRRDGDFMTNVPGVFVAGDMGRGQSLIVWAIAEGRACAAGVDRYLVGETSLPSPIVPSTRPLV